MNAAAASAGTVPTFTQVGASSRLETRAEIPGATRGRKSTLESYARRARRPESIAAFAEKVVESLGVKAKAQADEWLASPQRKQAHARKRYEVAMTSWDNATARLFTSWNEACFKQDVLKSVPVVLTAVFPRQKRPQPKDRHPVIHPQPTPHASVG